MPTNLSVSHNFCCMCHNDNDDVLRQFNLNSRGYSHRRSTPTKHDIPPICNQPTQMLGPILGQLSVQRKMQLKLQLLQVKTKCKTNVLSCYYRTLPSMNPQDSQSHVEEYKRQTILWLLLHSTIPFHIYST